MFPNDDLKKDVTSWKFVKLSDKAAQVLGFENADRIKEICQDVDFNEVRVPIHYDIVPIENEELEEFYFDSESDFLKPVVTINVGNAYDVMTSLEFLSCEFHTLDIIEIFEILTDFSR